MASRAKEVKKPARVSKKPPIRRSSGNVFADLGFDTEEAEHLKVRSALMATLRQVITDIGMTQTEAAAVFEVTQPRISDLMRGRIDLFSIDTLVDMLGRAGVRVELKTSVKSPVN